MGLWESSGGPPSRKIVSARHGITFSRGYREFEVLIKTDEDKEYRPAYFFEPLSGTSGGFAPYKFKDGDEAAQCAQWLIGRTYAGPTK